MSIKKIVEILSEKDAGLALSRADGGWTVEFSSPNSKEKISYDLKTSIEYLKTIVSDMKEIVSCNEEMLRGLERVLNNEDGGKNEH